MRGLTDEGVRAVTNELRAQAADGAGLDAVMPRALAAVREAARRALGQHPYPVQVWGAVALQQGALVEMKTGEGKTLTLAMSAYLRALGGGGVHVVTAGSYLAERDAAWMAPVYRFLGLECGWLDPGSDTDERRAAYMADVTYGDCGEFCGDFLADSLASDPEDLLQRPLCDALLDDADLLLLDQAQKLEAMEQEIGLESSPPLRARMFADLAARMQPGEHYTVLRSESRVEPTEAGRSFARDQLGSDQLFRPGHEALTAGLLTALRAKELFRRDEDYLVVDGKIVPVDPIVGRAMPGGEFLGALWAALEAKEGLAVHASTPHSVRISVPAYLRSYPRIGAITGAAVPDAEAYRRLYGLPVVQIPTRRPVLRIDHPLEAYARDQYRWDALTNEVVQRHATGQPVLVGVGTIADADLVHERLTARGIEHEVLTARDQHEAQIIARAGRLGAVTVITRMAGRGVDIPLGQGESDGGQQRTRVLALGGLYVIGADAHPSSRHEAQLRGRAGRQGDPGETRLLLSFEDEAMRGLLNSPTVRYLVTQTPAGEQVNLGGQFAWSMRFYQRRAARGRLRLMAGRARIFGIIDAYRAEIHALRVEILHGRATVEQVRAALERPVARGSVPAQPVGTVGAPWAALRIVHQNAPNLAREILLDAIDSCWSEHLQAEDKLHDPDLASPALRGRRFVRFTAHQSAVLYRDTTINIKQRIADRLDAVMTTLQLADEPSAHRDG